jgi:hypothetical protein
VAKAEAVKIAAADAKPISLLGRVFQGARDPADAISQIAYNALPASAQDKWRDLANWGAEKTGMDGRMDAGGANAFLKANEQQYQAGRLAANGGQDPGFDGGRLVGNFASPVNVALALSMPSSIPATLEQTLARGLVTGGITGLERPITDGGENFWDKKGKQAVTDGVFGMGGSLVGAGLARVISPKTDAQAKALMDEGVTPTIGQILGGGWAKFEDKMTGIPVLGEFIKNSQHRAVDDFNRAAYNRALEPIGQQSSANVGHAGVAEVRDALKDAYNTLLPKMNFRGDSQFSQEVGNLSSMVNNGNVPEKIGRQFDSIVRNDVFSHLTPAGTMDGQTFKMVEEKLTKNVKLFSGSQDPDQRILGGALEEVLKSVRGNLARGNPQYAEELGKINAGFANYARIRQAASSLGAKDGVFTPAQLQNAVRAGDSSAGKGNFGTGEALMQDLSGAGKNVLGAKYPDSGTPGRLLASSIPGWMGAAYFHPVGAAAAGAAGAMAIAPYTAMGQRLAAALLAKRPAGAETAADAVRLLSPALGTGLAPFIVPAPNN